MYVLDNKPWLTTFHGDFLKGKTKLPGKEFVKLMILILFLHFSSCFVMTLVEEKTKLLRLRQLILFQNIETISISDSYYRRVLYLCLGII